MLTQDDFMAPNPGGKGQLLRRSSWKAEAIRRGELKISGPIPITEDMPLHDVGEGDAAVNEQVEGSPPHVVDAPKSQSQDGSKHELAPLSVPPNLAKDAVAAPSARHDDPAPIEEPPRQKDVDLHHQAPSQPPQPQRNRLAPPVLGETDGMHRRSAAEPMAPSTPSPYPSINDGSTKGTPKKRKSGLRNVFRKMFGRRSQGEPGEREGESEPQSRGHSHHISDPGLLRASSERQPARRGQRISELPVQEPKPLNPLGQHLPFPMNVNAPQEVSPPHEYLTFEVPSPGVGRRRATLPGTLPDPDTHSLDGRMKQRLETWDERHDDSSMPSPQIGIALSSPPASTNQSKRRSRSAGALRELAKEQPSMERRRSSEIRHWRSSYASASVYSNRPQTAQTVDTVMSSATTKDMDEHLKTLDAPAQPTLVEPESSRTPVPQHHQDLSQLGLPVEAFNFGNLKSGFSDDEDSEQVPTGEHSRARSASPPHEVEQEEKPRRLSIEDRVKSLEEGMRTLQTSVHRLSGRNNRQTIILENAPKGRRGSSQNRSSSGTSERQGSHHSSSRSRSSSRALPFRENEECRIGSSPAPAAPPLYNDNAKPRSHIITSEDAQRPPTASHYHALLTHLTSLQNALTHERHSRKILESHFVNLQRELSDLNSLVNRLLRNTSRAENYPTPSPDTLPTNSYGSGQSMSSSATGRHDEEKMPTPRASRGFSAGEDSGVAGMSMSGGSEEGACARERYDGSGYASSGKEELMTRTTRGGKDSGDALASPEVWATPKEEGEFMFSGRGEDDMF